MLSGKSMEDVFYMFDKNPDALRFFKSFDQVVVGEQDNKLIMKTDLTPYGGTSLQLGKIDGHSADVAEDSRANNISPYWTYIGHRFDRKWVRTLSSRTSIKLRIILVEKPNEGLMTMTPRPNVHESTLTWNLPANQELVFVDGLAKRSLLKIRSYIEIDQIIVEPLTEH